MTQQLPETVVICRICGIRIGAAYTEKMAYPVKDGVICGNCKDNPLYRGDVRYRNWGKVMRNRLGKL